MNRILILLAFVLHTALLKCYASGENNDSIYYSKYKVNEEWYVQLQSGINYTAAENTRFVNFYEVLSPSVALSIGKRLSPVWGTRLQMVLGKDKGVYYANDKNSPKFSFKHYGFLGIGSFSITEFMNQKLRLGYSKRFNVSALMGIGALYTSFEYTKNQSEMNAFDHNNGVYLSIYAGMEASYSLSNLIDIHLELSSNWMNNKYNGQTSVSSSKLKADGLINLLVGVRYTFNNARRKFKPKRYVADALSMSRELPGASTLPRQESRHEAAKQNEAGKTETGVEPQSTNAESYHSLEELLEMANNKESLKGKQLAYTERIDFDYAKSTIKAFASIYLDKAVELMKKENIVLVIKGVMKEDGNNQLTEMRMKAVREYLMKNGIDRDRLVYQLVQETTSPELDENAIVLGILSL